MWNVNEQEIHVLEKVSISYRRTPVFYKGRTDGLDIKAKKKKKSNNTPICTHTRAGLGIHAFFPVVNNDIPDLDPVALDVIGPR